MKKLLTISILLIFFSSCATQNYLKTETSTLDSWIGNSKTQLVQKWGPPQSTASDETGGQIYIYDLVVGVTQSPGVIRPAFNNIYYSKPQSNNVVRTMMFFINKEGIIYHASARGNLH